MDNFSIKIDGMEIYAEPYRVPAPLYLPKDIWETKELFEITCINDKYARFVDNNGIRYDCEEYYEIYKTEVLNNARAG